MDKHQKFYLFRLAILGVLAVVFFSMNIHSAAIAIIVMMFLTS